MWASVPRTHFGDHTVWCRAVDHAFTTSWVTKDGHAFATRHGRIEIMECEHVKYLCKEHLGLDVLIGLPKPPPR